MSRSKSASRRPTRSILTMYVCVEQQEIEYIGVAVEDQLGKLLRHKTFHLDDYDDVVSLLAAVEKYTGKNGIRLRNRFRVDELLEATYCENGCPCIACVTTGDLTTA